MPILTTIPVSILFSKMQTVQCWSKGCTIEPEYRLVAVFWLNSRFGGESRGEIILNAGACREHCAAPAAAVLDEEFWQKFKPCEEFIGGPVNRENVIIESRLNK